MAGDLVIPEGFGEATWKWAVEGRANPISTTIGFTKASDDVELGALMNDMMEQLTRAGSMCQPSAMLTQFTFLGCSCIYNNAGSMVGAESDHPAVSGTISIDDALIISSTLIIRKRTGLIGRQYRGRFYFPFMLNGEAPVDYLGNINAGFMTAFGAKLDLWSSAALDEDSTWIPNLLHHIPLSGVAPDPSAITNFTLESKVGTQRRRIR